MSESVDDVQRITEPELVCECRSEGVNVLNADQAIVEGLVGSESRNIRPCATETRQRQKLRGIGEEESPCEGVSVRQLNIRVGVELIFIKARRRRARLKPVWLGCGNQELAIGELCVKQRQRSRVNRRKLICGLQGSCRPVVGQFRINKNVG